MSKFDYAAVSQKARIPASDSATGRRPSLNALTKQTAALRGIQAVRNARLRRILEPAKALLAAASKQVISWLVKPNYTAFETSCYAKLTAQFLAVIKEFIPLHPAWSRVVPFQIIGVTGHPGFAAPSLRVTRMPGCARREAIHFFLRFINTRRECDETNDFEQIASLDGG